MLFAGAAVGVSHLVQATRAGAVFGLGLLGVIVAANIIKYPAFAFGPRYAAATGSSLLTGYRRQGLWALILYAVLTVATMFTVQAAVTLVTAAIAKALFHLEIPIFTLSIILMVSCAALALAGRYPWLDLLMKIVVPILTILTVVATVLVVPNIDWSVQGFVPRGESLTTTLVFVAPLVGWMPSAIDISVWHSLWTLAKREQTGHAPSVSEAATDFNIGYVGTAVLAVCFCLLGAGVVFGTSTPVPSSAVGFANLVIQLYTDTLGDWSRYVIGGCAVLVMFSTTLTVVDSFPRALAALGDEFRVHGNRPRASPRTTRLWHVAGLAIVGVGTTVVLGYLTTRLTLLVDIATALSFLTAPILAWLNHRAVIGPEVPVELKPSLTMRRFSAVSIIALVGIALLWIYIKSL